MHADLEAANGASTCADYFFPKDKPGDAGITAMAIVDTASQFLAGHVVDAKGAGAEHAIKQILRDLGKWVIMEPSESRQIMNHLSLTCLEPSRKNVETREQ